VRKKKVSEEKEGEFLFLQKMKKKERQQDLSERKEVNHLCRKRQEKTFWEKK